MPDFPNGLTIFGGIGFDTTNNYGFFLDQEGHLHAKVGRITDSAVQVLLSPTQIQTLASVPVTVVASTGTNAITVPLWWMATSPGLSGYGTDIGSPQLAWTDGLGSYGYIGYGFNDIPDDGTVYYEGVDVGSTINPTDFMNAYALGGDLVVTANPDTVSVGSGTITILLTYRVYDLSGLL